MQVDVDGQSDRQADSDPGLILLKVLWADKTAAVSVYTTRPDADLLPRSIEEMALDDLSMGKLNVW